MNPKFYELPVAVGDIHLKVAKGHFATRNSHINYFIDVTEQKYGLRSADEVARILSSRIADMAGGTLIDTILCLDGTSVIGASIARQLLKNGYRSAVNGEKDDMHIIKGEPNSRGHIVFRDNMLYMLEDQNVLIMMASLTTGTNALHGKKSIEFYGGKVVGVAAIYSQLDDLDGVPVLSLYDHSALGDYAIWKPSECPLCKQGIPVDAVVNTFGYSKLR